MAAYSDKTCFGKCQTASHYTADDGWPLCATLFIDSTLKDNIGIVQGTSARSVLRFACNDNTDRIHYVALSEYNTEPMSIEDRDWTLIPVRYHESASPTPQSPAIRVSPFSPLIFSILRTVPSLGQYRKCFETRSLYPENRSFSVHFYDVVPLVLETVYVEIKPRSFSDSNNTGTGTEITPDHTIINRNEHHTLDDYIRAALSSWKIIHSGSEIALSSSSDSVNSTPPFVRIIFCEPVAQGILSPRTKIIVLPRDGKPKSDSSAGKFPLTTTIIGEKEKHDTENSAAGEEMLHYVFYSAGKQGQEDASSISKGENGDSDIEKTQNLAMKGEVAPSHKGVFDNDYSSASDSESLPDIISLAPPALLGQAIAAPDASTSTVSPVGREPEGTDQTSLGHSTRFVHPNIARSSAFSNKGATTLMKHGTSKHVFRTRALLYPISLSMINPPPDTRDDPESFVFVDVQDLATIACFSGDFARLEVGDDLDVNGAQSSSSHGVGKREGNADNLGDTKSDTAFRVVKVYGLPGLSAAQKTLNSRTPPQANSSCSSRQAVSSAPFVLLSPILLHNLGEPEFVSLATFTSPVTTRKSHNVLSDSTASSIAPGFIPVASPPVRDIPPIAREVTLHKISSPLSLDRALQPALLIALKCYFEDKLRIMKKGDLIAIRVNEILGRILFDGSSTGSGSTGENPLDKFLAHESRLHRKADVVWFRVTSVTLDTPDTPDSDEAYFAALEASKWGGIAMTDISTTRIMTAGNATARLPSSTHNPWEYYLGCKAIPRLYISKFFLSAPDPQTGFSTDTNMSSFLRSNHFFSPTHQKPLIHASTTQQRISDLIAASTSFQAIRLKMAPVVILLTSHQRSIGKATAAHEACAGLGIHLLTIDSYDILTDGGAAGGGENTSGGDVKTETYLKVRAERALACGPEASAILIRHIDVLTANRIVSAMKSIIDKSRVVIATTTKVDKVADAMRALFTHEIEMIAPEEHERKGILENIIHDMGVTISPDVDLAAIATKTAALVAGDLVDVVSRAIIERRLRLQKLAHSTTKKLPFTSTEISLRDIYLAGGPSAVCVIQSDFENAVDTARTNFADSIGAPKIPNVTWEDVGGLAHAKETILETIQLPLEHPELFAHGMKKRSGILLYGPPGTGKTLLAKAIATEFSLNFFSIKGPELLNMYIGESEANVRRVFQRARDARPCVVFFDELDSVAPKRGNQGDSGGVMDRIVSQLLAELDGMSGDEGSKSSDSDAVTEASAPSKGNGVFVVGATNRPDLLDPALLRPGRFDKMLYLGIPDTHDKQATILSALTRKFALSPDVQLSRVAESLPMTYTGADLYALCSGAMLKAITRRTRDVDAKIEKLSSQGVTGAGSGRITTGWFFDHLANDEDLTVIVTERDFADAKLEQVSSVSSRELAHFQRIRELFESQQA